MRGKIKCTAGTDMEELSSLVEDLVEDGGNCEISVSEDDSMQVLAVQSGAMSDLLKQYPEVLIIDATYKTSKYDLPLLTVMVVDGNGHGRPVWHFFIVKESASFVESAIET